MLLRLAQPAATWAAWSFLLNLLWEIGQLPFYEFPSAVGPGGIAWDVIHCTVGDVGIALAAFGFAALATRDFLWPERRPWFGLVVAVVAGLAWTVQSEWQNVYVRGAWTYAASMPTIVGVGLLPVLQWLTVPPLTLMALRRRRRTHVNPPASQGATVSWLAALKQRRYVVLLVIALTVAGSKVFDDVLGHESGPFDESVFRFIHEHSPGALAGFFATVTATGSLNFLLPVATFTALALALGKRWFDAVLVALSPVVGSALVFLIKLAVGRSRPSPGMEAFSDSSFPSGHTVSVAAFATAVALVLLRTWPRYWVLVTSSAVVWVILVALSRVVLGAHWPTDVLAAACLGAVIPLLASLADGTPPGRPRAID